MTTFFIGAFMAYAVETLKVDHPLAAPLVCGGLGGLGLAFALLMGAP